MAQWIPKTAWKVTNLNKRYGQQYMTRGSKGDGAALEAYASLNGQSLLAKDELRKRLRVIAAGGGNATQRNPFPGAVVLDLRDSSEQRLHPLNFSPLVVSVHPHDLISGAVAPILPHDTNATELFLVATATQRAVIASASLRHMGYHNVSIVDVETVQAALPVPRERNEDVS